MNEAPGTMFDRAYALHREGDVAAALAAYDKLLERWPLHADTLHYSGVLLYQMGQLEEAQRIEHSLESEPRSADAWCNLGLVFQAQGRYDKALSALNEALRHQPRNPAILNNRVGLLLAAGRVADAEATARRALVLAPNDATTHYHMALCQQAQGRNDEALASVERALRADPNAVAPAGLKAQIEESLGRFDAASATLRRRCPAALPSASATPRNCFSSTRRSSSSVDALSMRPPPSTSCWRWSLATRLPFRNCYFCAKSSPTGTTCLRCTLGFATA